MFEGGIKPLYHGLIIATATLGRDDAVKLLRVVRIRGKRSVEFYFKYANNVHFCIQRLDIHITIVSDIKMYLLNIADKRFKVQINAKRVVGIAIPKEGVFNRCRGYVVARFIQLFSNR